MRYYLRPSYTPNHHIKLCKNVISLLDCLLPLCLRYFQILLKVFYRVLLVLFALIQAREERYQVFDLLFFEDEVAGKFIETGAKFVGW